MDLVVPETPQQVHSSIIPTTDFLVETFECSQQQLLSSIIPPTFSLIESFEYSPAQKSCFDIGESPVSPTIPSPAVESNLELLGTATGISTSSSLTSSPETTIAAATGSWEINLDPIDPLWPELVNMTDIAWVRPSSSALLFRVELQRDEPP